MQVHMDQGPQYKYSYTEHDRRESGHSLECTDIGDNVLNGVPVAKIKISN